MSNHGNENIETTLQVDGMTCGSCARHVNEALENVAGVCHLEIRLSERKVVVHHDADASPVRFIDALREAGYDSKTA